ncbi:MAG: MerC family mercury resistance protein [Maricaulaceae bacterium]
MQKVDASAIGLSALCVAHCISFWLVAAGVMVFAPMPEVAHLALHGVFLALAAVLAVFSLRAAHRRGVLTVSYRLGLGAGLVCLLIGVIGHHDMRLSVGLTITGATILAWTHSRLSRRAAA